MKAQLIAYAMGVMSVADPEARVGIFNTDEWEVIAQALTSMDAKSNRTDKLLDSIREKLGIENPYRDDLPDGEE